MDVHSHADDGCSRCAILTCRSASSQRPEKRANAAVAAVKADQAATGSTAPKSEHTSERVFTQEEFRAQLESIDKSLRALPATAQVCAAWMCRRRSLLPSLVALVHPSNNPLTHPTCRWPISRADIWPRCSTCTESASSQTRSPAMACLQLCLHSTTATWGALHTLVPTRPCWSWRCKVDAQAFFLPENNSAVLMFGCRS